MSIVEVKNLTKLYAPDKGIKDVDLIISEPTILGLLGPNGAGKTTIVETILGLRKKDSGSITIFSSNQIDLKTKSSIGFQLQSTYLDGNLKFSEYLDLYENIFPETFSTRELLKLFGAENLYNRKLQNLSRGQYQRVLLCLAFIGKPKLVFLDEPSTGLDPINKANLRTIFKRFSDQGMTILLTSHDIQEVENLCNDVAIINEHKINVCGKVEKLIEKVNFKYKVIVDRNISEPIEKAFSKIRKCKSKKSCIFYFQDNTKLKEWIKEALNINIHDFKMEPANLTDFYFQYFGMNYDDFN